MDIKQSSPIFEDFLQSYLEKDAGISDKDWLKEKLKQESLNLTDEALEKLSSELAGGVESFNETLASIDNGRKQGQNVEAWLETKAGESAKNVTVDELQAVEGFLQGSNDRLLRSLKAAEQVKSVAKTSVEVVAEQILLDDFNRSSADSNARYEAAIDEASANSVYGRNLFDLVVKDKFTGKPLEHYQVMFGKTVQETIDMIAAADVAGQKFIVPQEMVEEVQKALPGKAVLDRLGGSKLINLASNPLSSKIIEKCLTGELPSVINQISSADSGTLIKSIANNAVASGVLSSGMLDGLEKVVGKKVINDFAGRDLLEQALLQLLHLHCFPYGNQALLHNPSYKYGHLIKSAHNPDYKSPYISGSGKLHLLYQYTIRCYHFSHMVEELLLLHYYGLSPTEFQFQYVCLISMADTVSVPRRYQYLS